MSPFTPAQVAELAALFTAAVESTAEGRVALLAQTSARDARLAEELAALLAAHDSERSLGLSPVAAAREDADRQGLRLGPWCIGVRIGAGGMGTVHEATRADDQYQQRVAVKFLRHVADGELAARRFRRERQILASLQHPRIAALLDGGVTPDGQPYFVMEYIAGAPITIWCDERSLGVTDRLRLFLEVCDAVRAAHRQLIVHRDLKPGNILVSDAAGVKLLDFGIARLLGNDDANDDQSADALPVTGLGGRVFTPDYAAPEQWSDDRVGTSADIYALGVVLFELLTGTRPFALRGLGFEAMARLVRETPAPRPSGHLLDAHAERLGQRGLARARRELAGDLDAIVGMALRKEPERRYASVDALMSDVQRVLDGTPVQARPDTVSYRLGKFIRRRWIESTAAAVALLSLVGGTVAATRQARRAEAQALRATEVSAFLSDVLGAAAPHALGAEATVRALVDSAAVRLDATPRSPVLDAELRRVIGRTYLAVGDYVVADSQFRRALDRLNAAGPEGETDRATTMLDLAIARFEQSRLEEADSLLRDVDVRFARLPDVTPLQRSTLLDTRAQTLSRLGRDAEALPLFMQSLALHREFFPEDVEQASPSYISAAVVASDLGRHVLADSLLREAIALVQRHGGPRSTALGGILSARATVLERLGEIDSAGAAYAAAIAERERILGREHPMLAMSMINYADHLRRRTRYVESLMWSRRVIALRGRTLPEGHLAVGAALLQHGLTLVQLDSTTSAEAALRDALRVRTAALPAGHWVLASTRSALGEVLTRAKRYAEAEALLLPAERQLTAELPHDREPVRDTWMRLAALYRAWGRPNDAERWAARARSAAPPA